MDLAKFVAMLDQRSIFFCRADQLGDRFEGAAGVVERRSEWDRFYLDYFRQAIITAPGQKAPLPKDHIEQEAARLLRDISHLGEQQRQSSFVSCWHASTGESEALWRLYCPPPANGLAIKTDALSLLQALGDDPDIELGRVQYVDFRKTFAGFHDRIFWKRKSLSHEEEVRAVVRRQFNTSSEPGILKAVDLRMLVHEVVPSPFAPAWFAKLIASLMARYGVSATVSGSELLSEPFF